MFASKAQVLLVLPQDVLDRVRVMAGKATTTLKLPVSVQIVLRALIAEGLKRHGDQKVLANIEEQAQAVRRIRSLASPRKRAPKQGGHLAASTSRRPTTTDGRRRGR
jgi:hypothetical protein